MALAAPLLAAALVALGRLLGWRGVDMPAQVYRVTEMRAHGFSVWDSQWYGGHWTLSYSVLYPALPAVAGVATVSVASAALAALGFERLSGFLVDTGGCSSGAARAATVVFAAGTVVQSAIGQLPFLTGEAFGLWACWAASRRRWLAAATLALGASLSSPLAGAFVALAMGAWVLSRWRSPEGWGLPAAATGVAAAAVAPVVATAVLFPGDGPMPYPVIDYAWEMAVAAGVAVLAGRRRRAVRAGALLFAAVATAAVVVASPLGGNVGRIEDVLALPLAVAFAWQRRRLVLGAVAVPLVLSAWGPAWGAITSDPGQPSAQRAFFAPLIAALRRAEAGGPAGRVEVVPTALHWEAAYVAPVLPLARGWERQLDERDNPLFYRRGAALTAASYRAWLVDNGVRFVALPNAPLDFAGKAEGRLVRRGVPGLRLLWGSRHWTLYAVEGGGGIVSPPGRLLSAPGTRLVARAAGPGPLLIRVRYSPRWRLLSGPGCVGEAPGSWVEVEVPRAETVTLHLSPLGPGGPRCAPAALEAQRGG